MITVANTGVSFYNDCVSHPETDTTLTDGSYSYEYINIIIQALIIVLKSLGQPKKSPEKKNHNRPKNGPAKTIFGQKRGTAMAGPAVPPTTALYHALAM